MDDYLKRRLAKIDESTLFSPDTGKALVEPDGVPFSGEEIEYMMDLILYDEGWTKSHDLYDCKTLQRPDSSTGIPMFKSVYTLHGITPPVVAALFRNSASVKQWNDQCGELDYIVDKDDINIIRRTFRLPRQCKDREIIIHEMLFEDKPTGSLYSLSKSCEHPKCPNDDNFVRGDLMKYVRVIREHPDSENDTLVTQLYQIDMLGLIPQDLANEYMHHFLILTFKDLKEFLHTGQ